MELKHRRLATWHPGPPKDDRLPADFGGFFKLRPPLALPAANLVLIALNGTPRRGRAAVSSPTHAARARHGRSNTSHRIWRSIRSVTRHARLPPVSQCLRPALEALLNSIEFRRRELRWPTRTQLMLQHCSATATQLLRPVVHRLPMHADNPPDFGFGLTLVRGAARDSSKRNRIVTMFRNIQ